ncbi:MAG TPA: electron transfer flavoprotein subunit alpha/FixB family protein, partial [Bacteroidota bacterium]
MNVLAFAEERGGKFKKSSLETIRAGRRLADTLGGEFAVLVAGSGVTAAAPGLGRYGAGRVIAVDDPKLARHSNTAIAKVIAEVARSEGATLVFLPASQMGKDIAPRVAIKLGAGLAADCVALRADGNDIIATRPVFAGKALLDV